MEIGHFFGVISHHAFKEFYIWLSGVGQSCHEALPRGWEITDGNLPLLSTLLDLEKGDALGLVVVCLGFHSILLHDGEFENDTLEFPFVILQDEVVLVQFFSLHVSLQQLFHSAGGGFLGGVLVLVDHFRFLGGVFTRKTRVLIEADMTA